MRNRAPNGAPQAFIEYALAYDGDDCLLWPYCKGKNGYGRVGVAGGIIRFAHRVVLERSVGPGPEGAEACHAPVICHNPACVNPKHLRWASRAENVADTRVDGTANRGERNGMAKLTEAQVLSIKADQRPSREVAKDHGVTPKVVWRVKSGYRWGHLS